MVGFLDFEVMWPEMAVTARRTVSMVKSSAMMPRQPEVPNLMGFDFVGEEFMEEYSSPAAREVVDEKGR